MDVRIVIVGKGGSGKDYLKQKFVNRGWKKSISYTTRLPREGESYGIDYHFVTDEYFKAMEVDGCFLETDCFNGWHYGTPLGSFNKENIVMIMTPRGVAKIPPQYRSTTLIIYLDIDKETRYSRLLNRNDADKADRRLAADEEDFKDFTDFDIRITNPNF